MRSIGPYQLISEIGRGQGGVIYLARKQGLERRYAVKVLLGDDLADEEAVKRFQLEAAVASKLDDPGIVGVFDTGRVAGKWYYAMEYIPGETLERRLARGPLGPPEASRLVSQLARTVHKAHARGSCTATSSRRTSSSRRRPAGRRSPTSAWPATGPSCAR